VAAGVLAAAAIVALATIAPTGRPAVPPALSTSASGSTAAPSEVGYARVAHASEPASAGAPPADIPRVLVARTWTSVRKARSKGAELEAVLLPGDSVVADSLGHDWYRVALEGEVHSGKRAPSFSSTSERRTRSCLPTLAEGRSPRFSIS
jgi:hypothetical protein